MFRCCFSVLDDTKIWSTTRETEFIEWPVVPTWVSERMPHHHKPCQESETSVSIWKEPGFKGMVLKLIYLIIKIKQKKYNAASTLSLE